ncbi:DUF2726 domain-containing protein [Salmonella enterica subsp. enterica serovar Muenchen]|nr:DUF2726 domain-containing protein [Salmonella enterica subsp. enterica serovar Muenchen]
MEILFFVIVVIAVIMIFLSKQLNFKKTENKERLSNELLKDNNICYAKKQFLTNRERKFYNELIEIVGENNYIMAQVRLADIIKPKNEFNNKGKEYMSLFRKISQWHCDFIIVEKETFDIKLVIELDDSSHKNIKRIERDKFFNEALKQAEIKLLRVYNIEEFKKHENNSF